MRNLGQRACPRCTHLSRGGCLINNVFRPCPISDADLAELRAFAEQHGRTWKSKLSWYWSERPSLVTPALLRFRNVVGPSRLHLVRLDGAWRPS